MPSSRRLAVAFVLCATVAEATGTCVTCTGPDATYRCEVEGARPNATGAALLCAAEIARLDGHKSCEAERLGANPCEGPLRVVRPELASPVSGAPELGDEPSSGAEKTENPTEAGELDKTGDSASQSIEGAGSSVGAASKKAWDCVASLFGNC